MLHHPRYPLPDEAQALAELMGMAFTMQFSERGWHLVDLQSSDGRWRATRSRTSDHVIEVPYDIRTQEYLWRAAIEEMIKRRHEREES